MVCREDHRQYANHMRSQVVRSGMKVYRGILGLDKQGLGLHQHDRLLAFLGQSLDAPLDPRLAALDLDRLRPEDRVGIGRRGPPVVDVQVRRDAHAAGQRGEAAAREALVQDGRQQAAVDDARVAGDVRAEIEDGHQALATLLAPDVRRDDDLVGARQRARGEVAGAQLLGNLQVRAGLGEGGVPAQLLRQRVGVDEVVDLARGLIGRVVEGEGLLVGRDGLRHDSDGRLQRRGGEADGKGKGREGGPTQETTEAGARLGGLGLRRS